MKSAIRREDTLVRLGGDGAIGPMTWTADDRQLVIVGDGCGWVAEPKHYYSSRLWSLRGDPPSVVFQEVPGYPDISLWDFFQGSAPYYASDTLAVGDCVYQYLSTFDHVVADWVKEGVDSQLNFNGAKLIYSPDGGRSWRNQDSSSPVVLEKPQELSPRNLAFFHEPQSAFRAMSFLHMGRGYRDNRDGYVYVYSTNGITEGTMNELVMFRVPKDRVLDRGAYEYFAEARPDGAARWTPDINGRGIVHTFPAGWVGNNFHAGWLPNVVYNAPLNLYMMVNCSGCSGSGILPRPAYLGLWIASYPWGPWHQMHEETAWTPAGDPAARAVAPLIPPKWVAADGKLFWLVWTDVQQSADEDVLAPMFTVGTEQEMVQRRARWGRLHPYFGFNAQRIDLVIAQT